MSPVMHRKEERPQESLRSSLYTGELGNGDCGREKAQEEKKSCPRPVSGLRLLAGDLRRLCPAAAAILAYGVVTHLLFDRFCPMLILTGFPCPGCGMTRALFLVLTGRFAAAWRFQSPVYGWILLAAAFGMRRYLIKKPRSVRETYIWTLLLGLLLLSSLALYGYRVFRGFPPEIVEPGGTLMGLVSSLWN